MSSIRAFWGFVNFYKAIYPQIIHNLTRELYYSTMRQASPFSNRTFLIKNLITTKYVRPQNNEIRA